MKKNARIVIIGHNDVMERSLYRYLKARGFTQVETFSQIGMNPSIQASVYEYFSRHTPEYVFLGSTRSGGIEANQKYAADFIYHNCEAQNNVLYAAHKFKVKKLLYFGSSCVYPKECPQPIREEYFLTGAMEPTSLPYSVAKAAGIVLCQAFRRQHGLNSVVMIPATVYGPGSDTDMTTAHVLGALIGKFTEAVSRRDDEVILWGTGNPRREFLYADDFAEACVVMMEKYNGAEIVNAGCGEDIAIKDLAKIIAEVTGYTGRIVFDDTKPDGTFQKLLDNQRLAKLGWSSRTALRQGIEATYEWYWS